MTVSFLLDYSIFADRCQVSAWGYSVGYSVLGTGRQRRQQNDTIQYIDFHLISPFSAVYLTPSFYNPWCPKSGNSLIQFLKRFNLLSELGLG